MNDGINPRSIVAAAYRELTRLEDVTANLDTQVAYKMTLIGFLNYYAQNTVPRGSFVSITTNQNISSLASTLPFKIRHIARFDKEIGKSLELSSYKELCKGTLPVLERKLSEKAPVSKVKFRPFTKNKVYTGLVYEAGVKPSDIMQHTEIIDIQNDITRQFLQNLERHVVQNKMNREDDDEE